MHNQSDSPTTFRNHLKECKGLGDVGADIFFREAQLLFDDLFPFMDKKAIQCAHRLGIVENDLPIHGVPSRCAALVQNDKEKFVRLVASLVRVELDKLHSQVLSPGKEEETRPPTNLPIVKTESEPAETKNHEAEKPATKPTKLRARKHAEESEVKPAKKQRRKSVSPRRTRASAKR